MNPIDSTPAPTPTRSDRWAPRVLALALIALIGAVLGVGSAAGAAVPMVEGAGWIRLAHLSPDTKGVDITVSSVSGGKDPFTLQDVAYGTVSDYTDLPQGTYTVAMRPAGEDPSVTPMLQTSVDIVAGKAVTVAAYGPNAKLTTKVFQDDLTDPAKGQARIRLIQASTVTDSVDVSTSTGTVIAQDATAGAATSYADVAAGAWTLDLTSTDSTVTGTADVDLAKGSITTLFVVDNSTGGLTIQPVEDSASVGDSPEGGVNTGGGFLAGPFAAYLD